MKKKVLIYASAGSSITRFVEFFDRQTVDVVAAITAKQVIDVTSVRLPELIMVVLTDELIERHTDLLLRLPRLCKEFILFNLSSIQATDLRALYDSKFARYFGPSESLSLQEHLAQKMGEWKEPMVTQQKNRRALLVDEHTATQISLNALLLHHQFEVKYANSFEAAEDQLLENKFDLVITNSYDDSSAGENLVINGRKGCNKNTSFFFLTLKSKSSVANEIVNFDPQKIFVSPYDLGAIDERMKLIH
jgi:hypothetical protein